MSLYFSIVKAPTHFSQAHLESLNTSSSGRSLWTCNSSVATICSPPLSLSTIPPPPPWLPPDTSPFSCKLEFEIVFDIFRGICVCPLTFPLVPLRRFVWELLLALAPGKTGVGVNCQICGAGRCKTWGCRSIYERVTGGVSINAIRKKAKTIHTSFIALKNTSILPIFPPPLNTIPFPPPLEPFPFSAATLYGAVWSNTVPKTTHEEYETLKVMNVIRPARMRS